VLRQKRPLALATWLPADAGAAGIWKESDFHGRGV
jgi:hypothetical protein